MVRAVGGLAVGRASIGIDLGTTNSCAWVSIGGRMRCVVASDGNHLFPSCVNYRKDGTVVVGGAAKKVIGNRNQSVVINAKRIIGRPFSSPEVQSVKNNCGCPVVERRGKPVFYIKSQDRYVTPVEVTTEILKAIIAEAEKQAECDIERVCVSIPVNFDENQRLATLQAVLNCGFSEEQVRLLNKPTAAAICYGQSNDVDGKNILVFDLGRDAFDVSILKGMGKGDRSHFEVCMHKENNHLGGADIDDILLDWVMDRCRDITGNDTIPNSMDEVAKISFRRKLLGVVEKAKYDLSAFESTSIELAVILPNACDGDENDFVLARAIMNDLIRDKVSETLPTIEEALLEARMTRDNIDVVLLVGSSSRLQVVYELVKNYFERAKISDSIAKISDSITKDECVAQGACLALVKNYDPEEIIAYSLDLLVNENEIQCVIPVKTRLPAFGSALIYTSRDYIDKEEIVVYQSRQREKGERTTEMNGAELTTILVTGFQLRPAGEVTLKTMWECFNSGILFVTVVEVSNNYKVLLDRKRIDW